MPAKKSGRSDSRTIRSKCPKAGAKAGKLVPQPHGGAIIQGAHLPGPGRPKDAVRAKLRELGLTKAVPLLEQVVESRSALTSDRLKAADLVLKYGDAKRELVIASDNAAAFFDCITAAATELFGAADAERLKARAVDLMGARA